MGAPFIIGPNVVDREKCTKNLSQEQKQNMLSCWWLCVWAKAAVTASQTPIYSTYHTYARKPFNIYV